MTTLLQTLNEAQKRAVLHAYGRPAMVIAGAGSGKTKVLTTRVAWLMQEGVHPSGILLVTFTNKASLEMIDRVERLTGNRLPFSGTFHRLCARILRVHGPKIDLDSDFVILDDDDQLSLMTQVIKEIGLSPKETKPRLILSLISSAKNELITPADYHNIARGKYQELTARLYPLYQRSLAKNGAVDFDDLLMKTVELLQTTQFVREMYKNTFEHILIDEYQDTNTAQLTLTKLLLGPKRNLFVVGDFAQAIYSWRGADYRNMLSLTTEFADMATYELSQNYRSSQTILRAASSVIAHNSSHPVLSLWTDQADGENIELGNLETDRDEVDFIVKKIRTFLQTESEKQTAVLYRTNAQSRAFEEGLISVGLPYRLVGGVRFYARKEIKDLLAYLRLMVHPTDTVALERIAKLGKKKLQTFLYALPFTFDSSQENTVLIILDKVLQVTGYLKNFNEHDEEDRGRIENIAELRSFAAQFHSLTEFLETVALVEQEALRKEHQSDAHVTLMSVHSAKGLEFDMVCLVGMEEGLFPHSRSILDPEQMEEERRLCYVAMTRAKEKLVLSFARRRLIYGRVTGSIISRFIAEIPSSLLSKQGNVMFEPAIGSSFSQTRFDDPSIDDFLSGISDASTFLER